MHPRKPWALGPAFIAAATSACVSKPAEVRFVGGTLSDLKGTGLVLQLNRTHDLVVSPGSVTFQFQSWLSEGDDYTVSVAAQPTNPPQTCTVAHGTGTASDGSDQAVAVRCGVFESKGSMASGRAKHQAVLLNSGKVLVAGGIGASGQRADAELYDPVAGTFAATGSMAERRVGFTATLLPKDGRVLVAGGGTSSAELYDPVTGKFSPTGSMSKPRLFHSATLLPDGRVLVAGGSANSNTYLADAELYDPASGSFSSTRSMEQARRLHTATLLRDGRVLIAGGEPAVDSALSGAEIYDWKANAFWRTGGLARQRQAHTETLLESGQVLVATGIALDGPSSAELFDPVKGAFAAAAGQLVTPRTNCTATLHDSGQVVIAGGTSKDGTLSSVEMYDPATGRFLEVLGMTTARASHSATLLKSGRILVVGGSANDSEHLATAELSF